MKLSKITIAVFFSFAVMGCSNRMSNDGSFEQAQQNYASYKKITDQYQIETKWWKNYNDPQLNQLIKIALANNKNLAKSAILVNKALYNANLIGANLVPTFSANSQSKAVRGAGDAQKNRVSTSHSNIAHNASLNLSYTLDLWQRLSDSASAAEWEKNATVEDLDAARLSLINAVISTYYNLAYFDQAVKITQENVKNYQKISRVIQNKQSVGLVTQLSVDQSKQAILQTKNALINLQLAQKNTEKVLRNLLNLTPDQQIPVSYPDLLNVKLQGINTNVPVSSIANRPDLKSALFRLQSGFKNLEATENSWYPSITLGASLSSSAALTGDLANNQLLGGMLGFNLPFLDWNRVKSKIKISEQNYQLAKLNYEQTVTKALNEINTYYYSYQQAKKSLANVDKSYRLNTKISQHYKNRYHQGIAELRDWLNAINTMNSSKLAMIKAKYDTLNYENLVYQAMAGKYIIVDKRIKK
ncbi:MAG: TolC family protein [Pasteurella sp.]|nr:TolC family protein [Pasteurella sp.]